MRRSRGERWEWVTRPGGGGSISSCFSCLAHSAQSEWKKRHWPSAWLISQIWAELFIDFFRPEWKLFYPLRGHEPHDQEKDLRLKRGQLLRPLMKDQTPSCPRGRQAHWSGSDQYGIFHYFPTPHHFSHLKRLNFPGGRTTLLELRGSWVQSPWSCSIPWSFSRWSSRSSRRGLSWRQVERSPRSVNALNSRESL